MQNNAAKIMFSAGEASGDAHTAAVFVELQKQLPQVRGLGMGGNKMRDAGIDIRFDSSSIAVIGLVEVLKHYRKISRALRLLQQIIIDDAPDLLVCVDYKEFNLKLARFAKRRGVKVLFYIGPQVWAWRAKRAHTYGKAVDAMAVIFPFETAYYQACNVPVQYVGHPIAGKVQSTPTQATSKELLGLGSRRVVGILPGSRANEISRLLPTMLAAAERLAATDAVEFILLKADTVHLHTLRPHLAACKIPVKVISSNAYDAIACCDAVMTASGTVCLECALLKIPMVITYRLAPSSYFLGKLLIKSRFIGLPNIIYGAPLVKELIQHQATPHNLAAELSRLLNDSPYRSKIIAGLGEVKTKLGSGNAAKNVANLAMKMLNLA